MPSRLQQLLGGFFSEPGSRRRDKRLVIYVLYSLFQPLKSNFTLPLILYNIFFHFHKTILNGSRIGPTEARRLTVVDIDCIGPYYLRHYLH